MKQIKASKDLENLRLDKALAIMLEGVSRSKIQSYLDNGFILVNSKEEKKRGAPCITFTLEQVCFFLKQISSPPRHPSPKRPKHFFISCYSLNTRRWRMTNLLTHPNNLKKYNFTHYFIKNVCSSRCSSTQFFTTTYVVLLCLTFLVIISIDKVHGFHTFVDIYKRANNNQ